MQQQQRAAGGGKERQYALYAHARGWCCVCAHGWQGGVAAKRGARADRHRCTESNGELTVRLEKIALRAVSLLPSACLLLLFLFPAPMLLSLLHLGLMRLC